MDWLNGGELSDSRRRLDSSGKRTRSLVRRDLDANMMGRHRLEGGPIYCPGESRSALRGWPCQQQVVARIELIGKNGDGRLRGRRTTAGAPSRRISISAAELRRATFLREFQWSTHKGFMWLYGLCYCRRRQTYATSHIYSF